MIDSIKRTLLRLSGKIYGFNPVIWYQPFLKGIATELNRVNDFKKTVLSSTVPNENMSVDSIEDYNKKYGIPLSLEGTDTEKINRIIEKASLTGWPGKDWFQGQIQKAGFQLYVIENSPLTVNLLQWGAFQWSPDPVVQWGLTARFIDPANIIGDLIVNSPPAGAGRKFLSVWGTFQWSPDPEVMWGTPDPDALNPQPFVYERTTTPGLWGFYFTLSPFSDRVATLESEFLQVSAKEYEYLKNLIIELKLIRNSCILQAKIV